MKRVLMIAFHLPPMRGSSGAQRTLGFARHLPAHGWTPVLLSAAARAYPDRTATPAPDTPPIRRAFALDSGRHLALGGRFPRLLAVPDRAVSWAAGAIPAALALIRRTRPAVIWTTSPVATAHLIGLALRRLTGLPWVADLRDPLTEDGFPADPLSFRVNRWLERRTLAACSAAVLTTPGAVQAYRSRYPELPPERFALIENGHDEQDFADLPTAPRAAFTLLHSGLIYPSERDPTALFQALRTLLDAGRIRAAHFRLVLRASGHDRHLQTLIEHWHLGAIVELASPLPYRDALAEMLGADALLLLQAANCNHQIPAKLYEYLRARRPILALTDPAGDTAQALRRAETGTILPLSDAPAICAGLPRFLADVCGGRAHGAGPQAVAASTRAARTEQLAQLLELVSTPAALEVRAHAHRPPPLRRRDPL